MYDSYYIYVHMYVLRTHTCLSCTHVFDVCECGCECGCECECGACGACVPVCHECIINIYIPPSCTI